jgi:hypothetical protein
MLKILPDLLKSTPLHASWGGGGYEKGKLRKLKKKGNVTKKVKYMQKGENSGVAE